MLATLILSAALAAPPGTHLTGRDGTLSWTVRHEASADLTPRRTVHEDADSGEVVIVHRPGPAGTSAVGGAS